MNHIICNQNILVLYRASGLSAEQQNTVESWYRAIYGRHVNEYFPIWAYYHDNDGCYHYGAAYSMWDFSYTFRFLKK